MAHIEAAGRCIGALGTEGDTLAEQLATVPMSVVGVEACGSDVSMGVPETSPTACPSSTSALEMDGDYELSESRARVAPSSHWISVLSESCALSHVSKKNQRAWAEACCNRSTTPTIEVANILIPLLSLKYIIV